MDFEKTDAEATYKKIMAALDTLPASETVPLPLKAILAKHKAAKKKAAEVQLHPAEAFVESQTKTSKKPGCQCPACQLLDGILAEPGMTLTATKEGIEAATKEHKIVTGVPLDLRPEWGLKEAIREFLLNAKDAETEFEIQPSVEAITILSNDGKEHLGVVITTPGAHLPHDALQGGSKWKSNKGIYGRYGDGILLAAAAILRTPGCSLSIVTGGYTYDAHAVKGDNWLGGWYKKPLVAFTHVSQADYQDGVQIQIDGVPQTVWDQIKQDFASLQDLTGAPQVKTKRGTIYFDEKNAGRVWVRGFRLPQTFPLKYGYDLDEAPLTRDRTLDPSVDIPYECACIWAEALVNPKTKGKADQYLGAAANSKFLDGLLLEHVIPLQKLANGDDIAKITASLVESGKTMYASYKVVPYDSLSADEQYNLNLSMAILLGKHAPKMLQSVEIFEGPSANWQITAAKVAINRKNLAERMKTLSSILGGLAEFQSKFADHKNAPPIMWASVMATSALERIWKELEVANKKLAEGDGLKKMQNDIAPLPPDLALAT